jgi:SAM-dependent MidA family methyltransferase
VRWIERLPETPVRGVVLGNEVLDALPCKRFVVRDGVVRELGAGLDDDGGIVESLALPPMNIEGVPASLPEGYRSEVCPRVRPWIASLADSMERGVALLFDYGLPRAHYYHPQRDHGTLRCHFKQRAHDDPYINIGVQDITAWVDFTAVAESAVEAGLDVLGFVTQAAFLLGTGLDAQAPDGSGGTIEQARWASEARQLLLPGEMGETFKAIALGKDFDAPLRGFALQDLRRFL